MSLVQDLIKIDEEKLERTSSSEPKTSLKNFERGGFITTIARDEWPSDLAHWREDLQQLAHNLRFAMKGKTPCIIGFASAQSGEGTSTLAVAVSLLMAHSMNEAHTRLMHIHKPANASRNGELRSAQALLLDTQWRHPSLHRLFGVSLAHGLAEILHEEISPTQAIKDVPRSSLKLMTAGQTNTKALRYDQIERLGLVLRELQAQFEFIFIDLPPLLHSVEAAELSKLCDGVVLIVKAHKTQRAAVFAAQRVLEKAEVNMLGCVLNQQRIFRPDWLNQRL